MTGRRPGPGEPDRRARRLQRRPLPADGADPVHHGDRDSCATTTPCGHQRRPRRGRAALDRLEDADPWALVRRRGAASRSRSRSGVDIEITQRRADRRRAVQLGRAGVQRRRRRRRGASGSAARRERAGRGVRARGERDRRRADRRARPGDRGLRRGRARAADRLRHRRTRAGALRPGRRTASALLVIDTKVSHELTDGGYGSRRDHAWEAASCSAWTSAPRPGHLDRRAAGAPAAPGAARGQRGRARRRLRGGAARGRLGRRSVPCWTPRTPRCATTTRSPARSSTSPSRRPARPAPLGARMTGGGFGGSAIALVPARAGRRRAGGCRDGLRRPRLGSSRTSSCRAGCRRAARLAARSRRRRSGRCGRRRRTGRGPCAPSRRTPGRTRRRGR